MKREVFYLIFRYIVLVLVAVPNLWIFYKIFTPLTIYPVYTLLDLVFDSSLLGNIILINRQIPIEIINACVAGSAYYLLLILNLSTPKIELKKRTKMLILAFLTFLILNILRIFFLSMLAISGSSFFNITHAILWYLFSIIFVIGIWFFEIKFFKIKQIPFYSDIKFLYKSIIKK